MAKQGKDPRTICVRERGQALVEYSLIIALIAVVAIAGLSALGGDIGGLYGVVERLAKAMSDAVNG